MIIENPKLTFLNFQGKPSTFNPTGNRSFGIVLDEELYKKAVALGYPVRHIPGDLEGVSEGFHYMVVHLPARMGFDDELIPRLLDAQRLAVTRVALAGLSWVVADRSGIKLFLVDIVLEEI